MDVYKIDTLVIGAGVVGLAVARALSAKSQDVWVVDKHPDIGFETSSRNSEVIHAGIYYSEGSDKARFCVEGKWRLYDYCKSKSISYRNTGKLIVATSAEQSKKLPGIINKAEQNGVDDLKLLDAAEVNAIEPQLKASAAVLSPSTGIIDSHGLMLSLLHDAQSNGAQWVQASEVRFTDYTDSLFGIELLGQNAVVKAKRVVNAAGLYAPWLLQGQPWFPQPYLPDTVYAKGNYFAYSGKVPFRHLIYPVPELGGLGVHLTLDLSGAGRFGPDVEWCEVSNMNDLQGFDYQVDESRKDTFARRVSEYWPGIDVQKLLPSYSGLRPKLGTKDNLQSDFLIQGPRIHGLDGLVNLFGIESPGLTASLAIAEHVASILE